MIHIGEIKTPAGRYNEKPTIGLTDQLKKYEFALGRLKTGTPPRLDARTINFSNLDEQKADKDPYYFSFLTNETFNKQVSCSMTYTNEAVHKLIEKNLKERNVFWRHKRSWAKVLPFNRG